jgi:hypothetical protein
MHSQTDKEFLPGLEDLENRITQGRGTQVAESGPIPTSTVLAPSR